MSPQAILIGQIWYNINSFQKELAFSCSIYWKHFHFVKMDCTHMVHVFSFDGKLRPNEYWVKLVNAKITRVLQFRNSTAVICIGAVIWGAQLSFLGFTFLLLEIFYCVIIISVLWGLIPVVEVLYLNSVSCALAVNLCGLASKRTGCQ